METFTETDADQLYQVSFDGLSRDELVHLGMLGRILDDAEHDHRFAVWFGDSIKREIDRRDGDDSIEGGSVIVPIRKCSNEELFQICMRLHLLREVSTLSIAERKLCARLHWHVISILSIRANQPVELDRFLTISDLAYMLDATLSQVQSLVRRGVLPKPKRLSTKHHVWNRQEVIQAINAL